MKKRAQMGEYIGIAVLLLIVILFVIFSKIRTAESSIIQAEATLEEAQITEVGTSAVTFSYATVSGIPMNELLGVYVCYGDETADYGDIKINIISEIIKKFDIIYKLNKWVLELNVETGKVFINSNGKSIVRSEVIPQDENLHTYDFVFPLPCNRDELGRGVIYALQK